MKKSNFTLSTWIALIVGLILLVFMFIELRVYLKLNDVILLLLFPIVITIITVLISTDDLKNAKTDIIENYKNYQLDFKEEITDLKNEINHYIDKNRLVCHGTKYAFPNINRSEFWDSFLINANKKFILLGNTNKSWLTGGNDQSNKLGNSIVAILENNGTVKILSENKEKTIDRHKKFIEQHVLEKIKNNSNNAILLQKFQKNFAYQIQDNLNFTAVVSDDRLIILPRMNNEENQEKCMVLELNHTMQEIYKNYLTDIEAIFDLAPEITFK